MEGRECTRALRGQYVQRYFLCYAVPNYSTSLRAFQIGAKLEGAGVLRKDERPLPLPLPLFIACRFPSIQQIIRNSFRPLLTALLTSLLQTRHKDSPIDGVGVIAVLKHEDGPQILLQKQFRPPAGKVCIEIPAGLLDANESGEVCAVRELKEETGYVGKAVPVAGGASSSKDAKGVMFNGEREPDRGALL